MTKGKNGIVGFNDIQIQARGGMALTVARAKVATTAVEREQPVSPRHPRQTR